METKRPNPTGTVDIKDITIGIELEMILFNLPTPIENVPYGGKLEFIADALEEVAKEMGVLRILDEEFIYKLDHLESKDTSPEVMEQLEYPELHFQIKNDITISPIHPTDNSIRGRGVEVCTPILTQDNWEQTIRTVCAAIIAACDKCGATVFFNETCGLHVHIGIGREYTVQELKQLSKAVVLFEGQMDYHHPPHRRPLLSSPNKGSMIASNILNFSLRDRTPWQMVWHIDIQADVYEVLSTINAGNEYNNTRICRFCKYNLARALTYRTVEFRQAAGTIDAEWIVAWVQNIRKFVLAATATEDEEWYVLAEEPSGAATDPELCRRFGLPVMAETDAVDSVTGAESGILALLKASSLVTKLAEKVELGGAEGAASGQ